MGDLTANFSRAEFSCTCGCGRSPMDNELIAKLQQLRTRYGKRIPIISGYRCPHHPNWSATSAHGEGKAVDPGIPKEDFFQVLRLAFELGFSGIGVKQHEGRYQMHLDTADPLPNRPRPWFWTYP